MIQNNINMHFLKIKHAQAIYWIDDYNLLIYKRGKFYSFSLREKKETFLCNVPFKKRIYRIFSLFELSSRLFRVYPSSLYYNKAFNELFFSFLGSIYSFSFLKKGISKELDLNHNASRTLSICGTDDGSAYFGEYPTKRDNKPISIYKRNTNKVWNVIYSFAPNIIRHIHHLAIYNNNLYCFTGDESSESNIFCFYEMNFGKDPTLLFGGKQKYRACTSAYYDNCLFYVTDVPYEANALYKIDLSNNVCTKLFDLNGPVIYGKQDNDTFYFASDVEYNLAKDNNGNNIKIQIDGKRGGVKSRFSYIYIYSMSTSHLCQLFYLKKDIMSIRFFGIGTFIFPCGTSNNYYAATSNSLKGNDSTYIFKKIKDHEEK